MPGSYRTVLTAQANTDNELEHWVSFRSPVRINRRFNPQNSLLFEFAQALVHQNGPAHTALAVK
jgi:hypothetical protein